nr:hypothetical protein [Ktedonobacteraceae bacterium]
MLPFLVVFGVVGILVVCGVGISLYLFNCGALGRRRRRSQRVEMVADEAMTEEERDEQASMVDADVDITSHYARNGIIVFFGGVVVIGILLTTIFNAVRH